MNQPILNGMGINITVGGVRSTFISDLSFTPKLGPVFPKKEI
jgi:hypothetical protein